MKYTKETLEFGSYSVWRFSEFENMTIGEAILQLANDYPNENIIIDFGQKYDLDHYVQGYIGPIGTKIPEFWKDRKVRKIGMIQHHFDDNNEMLLEIS